MSERACPVNHRLVDTEWGDGGEHAPRTNDGGREAVVALQRDTTRGADDGGCCRVPVALGETQLGVGEAKVGRDGEREPRGCRGCNELHEFRVLHVHQAWHTHRGLDGGGSHAKDVHTHPEWSSRRVQRARKQGRGRGHKDVADSHQAHASAPDKDGGHHGRKSNFVGRPRRVADSQATAVGGVCHYNREEVAKPRCLFVVCCNQGCAVDVGELHVARRHVVADGGPGGAVDEIARLGVQALHHLLERVGVLAGRRNASGRKDGVAHPTRAGGDEMCLWKSQLATHLKPPCIPSPRARTLATMSRPLRTRVRLYANVPDDHAPWDVRRDVPKSGMRQVVRQINEAASAKRPLHTTHAHIGVFPMGEIVGAEWVGNSVGNHF